MRLTTTMARTLSWTLFACSTAPVLLAAQLQIPVEASAAPPPAASAECDSGQSTELARQALADELKDEASAAALYRTAWEACRENTLLLVKSAEALQRQREFERAADTAREAVDHGAGDVRALMTLANASFMAQRLQDAKETVNRVLELEPVNTGALILLANTQYLLGDSTQAEQVFLKVLDMEPENEGAAYMLGRVYYMESRIDHAMGMFQRALKVNPKSYKSWDNLGLCYDAAGDYEKAVGAFLQAIKIVEKDFPDYDWPYANLADLLLRQNDWQQAYQAATIAAKRNPFSARNFFLGGKALSKLDRTDDSLKWLERSTNLDPNYPDPLYLLGQMYMKTGQREKAEEALDKFRAAKEKAPKQRR